LATKRGNSKHLRKIKRKIKLIQDILKKNRINRGKSNIVFLTLTFDRNRFLNNIYVWNYLSDYINDFLENLKKKLRKKGNDIEFFIKTYEYHKKDYFPHVHIIMLLNKPLVTFHHKGKIRFASKRRLFEWQYGFTDAEAPKNVKHTLGYLVKYCVKNYFKNYDEIENVQDANENKEEINGIKLNKNDILLTILWLFRKFTISHSRIRLDFIKSELTYSENLLKFKGLIIINYTIQFIEFIKEWYKIHEVIYFKIYANKKIIEIENDMFSLDKNRVEIDDNHVF
jgi:hypothetical protein